GPRVLRGDQGTARTERQRESGAAGHADARKTGGDAAVLNSVTLPRLAVLLASRRRRRDGIRQRRWTSGRDGGNRNSERRGRGQRRRDNGLLLLARLSPK